MTCFENKSCGFVTGLISSIFWLRKPNDDRWFCSCQHNLDIMFWCLVLLNLVILSKFLLFSLTILLLSPPYIREILLCGRTFLPAALSNAAAHRLPLPLGLEEDEWGLGVGHGCSLLATSRSLLPLLCTPLPRFRLRPPDDTFFHSSIMQSLRTPESFPLIFWRF